MSIEKNMNTRIQHKHDTEANWNKAVNFIPKIGEIIVYDIDENNICPRIKIGNGINTVNTLKFIDETKANKNEISQVQIITWEDDD